MGCQSALQNSISESVIIAQKWIENIPPALFSKNLSENISREWILDHQRCKIDNDSRGRVRGLLQRRGEVSLMGGFRIEITFRSQQTFLYLSSCLAGSVIHRYMEQLNGQWMRWLTLQRVPDWMLFGFSEQCIYVVCQGDSELQKCCDLMFEWQVTRREGNRLTSDSVPSHDYIMFTGILLWEEKKPPTLEIIIKPQNSGQQQPKWWINSFLIVKNLSTFFLSLLSNISFSWTKTTTSTKRNARSVKTLRTDRYSPEMGVKFVAWHDNAGASSHVKTQRGAKQDS